MSDWLIERIANGISGVIMFWFGYWIRGRYEQGKRSRLPWKD